MKKSAGEMKLIFQKVPTSRCKFFRFCTSQSHDVMQNCVKAMVAYYRVEVDGSQILRCPHCKKGYNAGFEAYLQQHHSHFMPFSKETRKKDIVELYRQSVMVAQSVEISCQVEIACQTEEVHKLLTQSFQMMKAIQKVMKMMVEISELSQRVSKMASDAKEERRIFALLQVEEFNKRVAQWEVTRKAEEERMWAAEEQLHASEEKMTNYEGFHWLDNNNSLAYGHYCIL